MSGTKTMNDWLNEARAPRFEDRWYFNRRVICADGYSVSIQASDSAYCQPRSDFKDIAMYHSFELGFPSEKDEIIMDWCEEVQDPTGTVYAYVPRDVVEKLIEKHGGITALHESVEAD
ncbi:hypothetical protein [Hafnia alvei]|uniref:Uncharacterized protein n=2 Tax=Hafnia alvei TaxID=569 RepID=A0A377PPU8_HAFAL|nr:hypothetical protein [Hafnia alvei]KFC86050.1 hypothetical protein GHAL_3736 [Hafnia alvei ATCC 13337]RLR09726.1 hypothetical protein EAE69_12445 [Hafnia alvei ATCC 13337]WQD24148.1 hypothetical protein U0008_15180 [Hafnia alvei]STQ81343.1 Uncharacterised protein [Hafnia alvei]